MPVKPVDKKVRKETNVKKIYNLLTKFNQVVLVRIVNVRASQVQDARRQLVKKGAQLLIGKNSVIKKAINLRIEIPKGEQYEWFRQQKANADPNLKALLPLLKDKVALVFSNDPVAELKPIIEGNRLQAGAKAGMVSNLNYTLPPGPTSMDPSQIGFFHALSISTKIVKGQIEITKEYPVCQIGKKVGNSEVVLLQKMNVKPFSYGMEVSCAYDNGTILSEALCGIGFKDVFALFQEGVKNVAALSLETGYVTELSVQASVMNAFKNLAAIGLETKYSFDALKGAQSSGPVAKVEAPKKAVAVVEEKVEEAEDVDLGGGLFGDDF